MGGGAATASISSFKEFAGNNTPSGPVWTNSDNELVPGRLMYDAAHWQSGFANGRFFVTVLRSPRADEIAARPWSHADHWTGGEVRAPDYRKLPAEMHALDPSTDPLPPTRLRQPSSQPVTACEYLMVPNVITEDVDPSDTDVHIASTLDTLYDASSFLMIRSPAPIMTWYHGADVNRFVFTGFAPWLFRRDECIALTDFVLQDIWGLQRESVDRSAIGGQAARGTGTPQRVAAPRGAAGRAP
jgi:hypothetical protein